MSNLTIAIDEEVLKRARIRALQQGTSVNAILRSYLETFAGESDVRAKTLGSLLHRSRKSRSGRGGRTWTRDELHER